MDMLEQGRLVAHGFAGGIECPGSESGKVRESGRTIRVRLDDGVELRSSTVETGGQELEDVDVVVGCVDSDVSRLHLNDVAMSRGLVYMDLASDVDPTLPAYGGRVFFALPGTRCLSCADMLDQHDLAVARLSDDQRRAQELSYGIRRDALGDAGPAVVSINGAVASLGVTELMMWCTGLRVPYAHLVWYGHEGRLGKPAVDVGQSCYYCRR
jgi:hypothetical protein